MNQAFLMAGFPFFTGIRGLLLGFFIAVVFYSIVFIAIPNVMAGETANVRFRIYGDSPETFHDFPLLVKGSQVVDDPFYDRGNPTVFYFHGFTENPESESVQTVVTALMEVVPRPNIIVVDWSIIAGNTFYPIPAVMTRLVGKRIARRIDKWITQDKLEVSRICLIGHSLGAQCASFVAKTIRSGRVPTLIGLDPAYPGFFIKEAHKYHIWRTDADMVIIIHTDAGVYGVPYNTGWADFYPNGGRRVQPGCPTNTTLLSDADFCSHWRAWQILSESVKGGEFVALRCDKYEDFLAGRCNKNFKTTLDIFSRTRIPRGSYYFLTAAEEPWSLGEDGINPHLRTMTDGEDKGKYPKIVNAFEGFMRRFN